MNKLDSKVKELVTKDIYIPNSYKNMIRNCLTEEKNINKRRHFKLVPAVAMGIILTSGIGFASTYKIKNFFNHNEGMDTAIENGYILQNDVEYKKSNNIGIKVENLLMDDYNLNISFSIQLDENIDKESIKDLEFLDMIIVDNDKKILYCEDKETFEEYCKNNNIEEKWKEISSNNINTGSNKFLKAITGNTATVVYNLYTGGDIFPKSKSIDIQIHKTKFEIEKDVIFEGDWKLNVDIPKKFYNRENYIYQVESCTRDDFRISDVNVYNTGTKIELTTDEFPELPYNLNDDEKTKKRKIEEFEQKQMNMTVEEYKKKMENRKIKNEYIENENGERFYPAQSTDSDGGYSNTEMKYLNYWQTFTMTKYDATDKLKIYMNYKGEDVYIVLKRKN